MKKGFSCFSLFFLLFFSLVLCAEDSIYSTFFHNDGVKIEKEYYPNHAEFKRTISEMNSLKQKHKCFATSASLIKTLDNKITSYYYTTEKIIAFYKKKWNMPNYKRMSDKWKEETYKKHNSNLALYYSLTTDLQTAYNKWNQKRNDCSMKKNIKEIVPFIIEANNDLSKALNENKAKEKEIMNELEALLNSIKS